MKKGNSEKRAEKAARIEASAQMDLKPLIIALMDRVKNPPPSLDDLIGGSKYKDEGNAPKIVNKKMPVYMSPSRHQELREKLLKDGISFNGLGNALIDVYMES